MPLPMSANMSLSPAGQALGLGGLGVPGYGGPQLQEQVGTETEEMRRKRLQELQQRQLLGPGGSAAAASLFGSAFGGGLGGIGL